jgi:scyllo-inositol 2-dehydrogenase (NAD+)
VNESITAAIVGYGRIASGLGRDYRLLPKIWNPYSLEEGIRLQPSMKLRAVCDLNAHAMVSLPINVQKFLSYESMIGTVRPRFLAVTMRTQGRAAVTNFALENGVKYMHLEKPLCNSKIEILKLRSNFAKHNAMFSYGAIRRYLPPYKLIKKLIETGNFGSLRKITVDYGSETLFWTHPHSIDAILFFIGEYSNLEILEINGDLPEVDISSFGTRVVTDPVINNATLRFDNNILVEITSLPTNSISLYCGETQFQIIEDGRRAIQINSSGTVEVVWDESFVTQPLGYASVLKEMSFVVAGKENADMRIAMEDAFKGQSILFDMCLALLDFKPERSRDLATVEFLGKASNGFFA